MKKFDIKWLLILVLVVVLAFGLVACNKDKGSTPSEEPSGGEDPTPGPTPVGNKSTPAVFFQELWTASKNIGATQVNPATDKIKISIEGDMEYSSDKVKAGSTDIGMEMGIVLDLPAANASSATLGDTALKLKFYDKTDANNKNWFTVWYFFNDESKIYFQVKNEYFVLGFDAYWNAQFTTLLGEVVNDKTLLSGLNNITPFKSIMDVVNYIAQSGGADWSLDKLIVGETVDNKPTSLLGLFGLNLKDLLNNDIVKSVLKIDTTKDVSLEGVLKTAANIILDKNKVTKEVKGDVTYYTARGLGSAKGILNGMVDSLLSYYDIALSFGTDGTKFHGFTIEIFGNKNSYNADLKINITKMEIAKETSAASAALALPAASTFKSNVAFSVAGEMNLADDVVVINPNKVAIGFGTYSIKFNGSLDLVGPVAENKTAAELQIIDGTLTAGTPMLTATYKDRTLSILVDPTNAKAAAIMKAGLPALADLIKKYSTGEGAEVPFALFTTMANDVLTKAFTDYGTDGTCNNLNTTFKGVEVTGVDIATLAKGAFYAIFQNVATHIDEEKGIGAKAELETYAGDVYKLGTKYYKDSQYAWSLNILNVVQAVIGNISYNETSKDYTLGFENIYTLLSGIFKDAKIQSYSDAACETKSSAADVKKPADVNEMMALFMCTNDGLLKELTNHGILPLYKDGITTKFLSSAYTPEMAAEQGYSYISGKMVTKAEALAIWNYICGNTATLSALGNTGYTYFNCDADPDKTTEAGFVENSLIQWFFKFINGSSVLTNAGTTPADKIAKLAGTGSKIAIDLNKDTGYFGAHIALNGKECNGTFKYDFTGTNTAYVPTMSADLGSDSGKYTTVALDNSFYTLFKAAYGQGYNTIIDVAHDNYGINNSIYYAATVETNSSGEVLGYALDADHKVCVLVDATNCVVYSKDGSLSKTYTLENDVLTIADIGSFDVYGNAFKLAQAIVNP